MKNKGVFMSEYEIVNSEVILYKDAKDMLNDLARICREAADKWYHDPRTGEQLFLNKGERFMLMVSELAEGFEGVRKDLMDDHLPHRKAVEVELADAIIRILDYCGDYRLDIGGALVEKMAYNATRKDHSHEARNAENGKKF
jgi:NTP pyrophosphatase (non-canonical NTP hydrolase)